MKKLMTGNSAAAYAAQYCRVQIISAYPITPQTTVVEKIADLCASGEMPARMIRVESEHSSMAACVGAAATGARVFTATSSQGLAYMHEMLHWASGSRLPIVMVDANRAVGAPWNLGVDQIDTLSQRDTGWMQFYCETNQEVLDTVIQAYRIAESIHLPVLVTLDGFYLSHTTEMVDLPEAAQVDRYLPPLKPLFRLDTSDPRSFCGTTNGPQYTHFRYECCRAMREAHDVAIQAMAEFGQVFGRQYGLIDCDYLDEETDLVLLAAGSMTGTIRHVVREMRAEGQSIGLIKLRSFRPFPTAELIAAIGKARKLAIVERGASTGVGGVICQEVKAALHNQLPSATSIPIFDFIAGLGGIDITLDKVRGIINYCLKNEVAPQDAIWVEV